MSTPASESAAKLHVPRPKRAVRSRATAPRKAAIAATSASVASSILVSTCEAWPRSSQHATQSAGLRLVRVERGRDGSPSRPSCETDFDANRGRLGEPSLPLGAFLDVLLGGTVQLEVGQRACARSV